MNNPAPHPEPTTPPPLAVAEIAARLDSVLFALLAVIAAHFRILGPRTLPLWTRISRARQLFARLLARIAAGHRPRIRPPHTRTPSPKPEAELASSEPPKPALPAGAAFGAGPVPAMSRRFAWVIDRIGYQAAGHAAQLNHLLQQPAVAETLAASPGIVRRLRPLCRILGIELPAPLRPPEPARVATAPATPRPDPKPRPPKPPEFLRPLPSYVRAAMRAWKRPPPKLA